jgi:site-specific DNA recombinase
MTMAAIYARVSSARQREEQTIASQTAALLEHAAGQGLEVPPAWVFEDEGYSGATLVRPALERLRDLAAQVGVDLVLCYAPDRLARKYAYQALLVEEFARVGTEVRFLNGPTSDRPEDALLVQFQGMIAEYERAQIGERTRRGKLHRARAGSINVLAGAPYGYRYIRKSEHAAARFEVSEPEATTVRAVYRRYIEDGLSIGALTRWLTASGVPTATGKRRWDRSTVWAMLRNPAYAGRAAFGKTLRSERRPAVTRRLRLQGRAVPRRATHRDRPPEEWIEIGVPPIVSGETFAAAARRLADNQRFATRNTKTPSLLTGLVSCQRCGYAYYRSSTRTSARKLYYYRCLGSDGWRYADGPVCSARPIRQEELDALVWAHVTDLLADPALIRAELERRLAALRGADPTVAQRGRLEVELHRVRSAAGRLVAAYQEDLLSLEELRARMPDLRSRESSLRAQLDALDAQLLDRASYLALAESLESFLGRLRDAAETASLADRQRILRLVVRDILIGPDEIVIRHSIPTSGRPGPPGYALRGWRHLTPARQRVPPCARRAVGGGGGAPGGGGPLCRRSRGAVSQRGRGGGGSPVAGRCPRAPEAGRPPGQDPGGRCGRWSRGLRLSRLPLSADTDGSTPRAPGHQDLAQPAGAKVRAGQDQGGDRPAEPAPPSGRGDRRRAKPYPAGLGRVLPAAGQRPPDVPDRPLRAAPGRPVRQQEAAPSGSLSLAGVPRSALVAGARPVPPVWGVSASVTANAREAETVGEPDEGEPHVRFDEGRLEPEFRGSDDLRAGGEPPGNARRPIGTPRQPPTPPIDDHRAAAEMTNQVPI